MKLIKKSDQVIAVDTDKITQTGSGLGAHLSGNSMNRREFLHNSSLVAGGAALTTMFSPAMIKKAKASDSIATNSTIKKVKSVCTHCAVGCGVIAEVQNGVWTGQEPAFDHPISKGAHCAKGASVREHGHGERRLKYPTL